MRSAEAPGGVLFAANHSCWWDLYLAHVLNETIPVDGYGMMEHANLARFGFFRRIGAFSVDRSSPAGIRASHRLRLRASEPAGGGRLDLPAGQDRRERRPAAGFPGRTSDPGPRAGRVTIVPVALRYEFWQDERPEAFVRFGEPIRAEASGAAAVVEEAESRVTAELDLLRDDVVAQRADRFQVLLEGRRSISDRYGRLVASRRRGSD